MAVTFQRTDLAYACMTRGLSWPWETIIDDLTSDFGEIRSLPVDIDDTLYPCGFIDTSFLRGLSKYRNKILLSIRAGATLKSVPYPTTCHKKIRL